jgi:hypothetical protein
MITPGWIIEMATRVAKSFEVLPLIFIMIFITDCSPIDRLQSVLKNQEFENFFFYFLGSFKVPVLAKFSYTPVFGQF